MSLGAETVQGERVYLRRAGLGSDGLFWSSGSSGVFRGIQGYGAEGSGFNRFGATTCLM